MGEQFLGEHLQEIVTDDVDRAVDFDSVWDDEIEVVVAKVGELFLVASIAYVLASVDCKF